MQKSNKAAEVRTLSKNGIGFDQPTDGNSFTGETLRTSGNIDNTTPVPGILDETLKPLGSIVSSVSDGKIAANPTLSINDTSDHVINFTEASNVSFTVSGLSGNAAGVVTFTDATQHQVVVDVGANGNYSADLSTLDDGTITSSLSVTGPAGHTASASGNAVTLETDKDLTPTVVVDAGDPAHVTFTISGLEGDETGTMTFTDTLGHSDVISIGSNGSYSANLANLANGTLSYLVSVTDPVGNVTNFDPTVTLGDGSANAPAGTPEFATLLNSYALRPSWYVAGVDYYVGTPSGTVLKNPTSISMAGVSVNSSSHIITISASNVTLDGYDFSLNGGWGVVVGNGANNVTIENSLFKVGTNNLVPIDATLAGSVNVLYNTFDGGGAQGHDPNQMIAVGGLATIQYNHFTNIANDVIDFENVPGGAAVQGGTVQYNLADSINIGDYHSDFVQTYAAGGGSGNQTINSLIVQYNTYYEPPSWSLANTGGDNSMVRIGDQGSGIVSGVVAAYNTFLFPNNPGGSNIASIFQWGGGNGSNTLQNAVIHDNYFDPTEVLYQSISTYIQSTVNPETWNNYNMVTGKQVINGPWESQNPGGPATPPAAPVITTNSTVNTNHVQLTGTAPANDTIAVFDQGVLLGSVNANASGAWSFTTGTLSNGSHSLTARATDAYANTSAASAAVNATIGVPSGPTAPTIASFSTDSGTVGDGITNDNTLTLTGSAEANATVKVFDGTTLLGSATANASGAWSYTTVALANGAHSLTATATDAAGNTGAASSALSVTIDTTAPVAPTIASFSTDSGTVGDGITNDNTLTLTGSAEANATVKVFDGTTLLGSATANASGAWSYTTAALANGAHSLTATATDAAGNTGAASSALSVTIDTTAPVAPTIASFSTDSGTVGDGITNDNTLTLTGSAEANATVKVFDGTTLLGSATANAGGAWSYTTVALANGAHSLTATATDAAGNTGAASSALSVTIDTTAPVAPVIADDTITNTNEVMLTGTAEANSTVNVFDGTTQIGTAVADGTGAWSYLAASLADGSHAFTATATDAAGNTSIVSQPADPIIGTVAPVAPTIASFSTDSGTVGDGITNDNTLTLTGSAEANATVKVFDGTTLLGSATANAGGAWSYTTVALANGAHSLTATATDAAGNTGAASSALSVTIDTTAPVAPTIASFSTDSGTVGDGITNDNTLTLTGSAEANATVKVFDGTTLLGSATANASGAWSYTTVALANGAHSLTATATDTAGNTGAASSALSVTIDTTAPVAPTIASFSTDSGTVGDGITNDNTLTLTGSAEANATVKVFDGTTLLGSATANASGAWSYTTAALANGAHSLTATATDAAGNTGAASSALSVTIDTTAPVAPTIASFSTDSGTVGDGITNDNTLTLTGSAEANATVKVFDGTTLLGSATANASGAWSYTTAALANGAHSLTATATDAAGNTGAASSALSVTIDTTAPVAPVIADDTITNTNEVMLTGTAEANSTVNVFDGTTQIGTAVADGTGAWSYLAASLADGSHAFTATATDAAGNTSIVSQPADPIIGTVAPVAVDQNLVANGSFESGDFSGWMLGGNYGASPYGPQTFVVGNAQSGQFAAGLGPVSFDGTLSQDIQTTAGQHYTLDFWLANASSGANDFTVTWNGHTLMALVNASSQEYTEYTFDVVGYSGTSHLEFDFREDPAYWSLDSISVTSATTLPSAPSAPSIFSFSTDTGVAGDGKTSDNQLLLTGTAAANSTVKVFDGVTLLGSAMANASGAWSFATDTLSDGTHSFMATDTISGHESAASSPLNVTVDTVAPTDVITSDIRLSNGAFTLTGSVVDGGVAGAGDMVKVYDGTTYLGSTTAGSNGQWSFTTTALSNKTHSFTSTATDAAGNVGKPSGAAIYATNASTTLVGTSGNDIMTGANGSDTFAFNGVHFGNDVITDFHPQGGSHDTIQFNKSAFSTFAAVLAHATEVGNNVVITLDAADTVTLQNVAINNLTKSDFHLI